MDRNIVFQGLKRAQALMNDQNFNNKVNGYINNGAGYDTYTPTSPKQQLNESGQVYDELAYTPQQAINSKLPKNILESMLNNPINVTPANSGFGSVLGNMDTEELERQVPVQMPRRQLSESAPVIQTAAPAGIDSNYLKFLVKEAVKECMDEMKQEILSESKLQGLKIGNNNTIMLVDQRGNLYEAKMTLKKKAQQK